MKIGEVKKLPVQERFLYWIKERESIRLKKELGEPWPWSDDEILNRYRFCNVRRMDDKVSKWLYSHWYYPNFNHKNMVVAVSLARFINKIETLDWLGFPEVWDQVEIKNRLRERRKEVGTLFGAAYMVRGNNGKDKVESVVTYNVNPLYVHPITLNRDSMQETWKSIASYYGMGSFMAGQIVADLRWAMKGEWRDANSWAPKGPGSMRGMNRFWGKDIHSPISDDDFKSGLASFIALVKKKLPHSITSRLEACDYQSCFCEGDKYERTLQGQGKPKQLYKV